MQIWLIYDTLKIENSRVQFVPLFSTLKKKKKTKRKNRAQNFHKTIHFFNSHFGIIWLASNPLIQKLRKGFD